MRFIIALCAAASVAALVPQAVSAQNIVTNGNFETGNLTGWTSQRFGVTSSPSPAGGSYSAESGCTGTSCVDPTSASASFLSQTLSTIAGKSYTLTFDYQSGGNPSELKIFWNGSQVYDIVDGAPASGPLPDFTSYSVGNLMASSAGTNLAIYARQDPGINHLDNISVVASPAAGAVPEPASWAMMIGGFGMVGGALRRRRGVARTAIA